MSTESSDSGFQMNPTLSLEIDDSNSKESHGENKLEPPATKGTFDSGVELSSSDKNADELCKSMGQLKMAPEPTKKTSIWENCFLQNEDGDTYLHWVVINKAIHSAWKMIKVSPRLCLDIQNDFGQTALHIAVLVDQPKVVGWLVAAGASLGIRDAVGNNPLHLACIEGKIACLKELLAANAPIDFEQLNYSGKRCVHIAAEKYNIEILRCLVNAGADINSRVSYYYILRDFADLNNVRIFFDLNRKVAMDSHRCTLRLEIRTRKS